MNTQVQPAAVKPVAAPAWRAWVVPVLYVLGWFVLYDQLEPATDAFMRWLSGATGLASSSHLYSALAFFVFEVPKVLMLLALIVFVVGVIQTFFTPERTRAILAGKRQGVGNVLAAALGIVTPFCSCSAAPLFIGFLTAGVPLGVTFSFLVSAPMVNEVTLALLFGLFGWKIAAIYLGLGLTVAIVAGLVIGRMNPVDLVESWVFDIPVVQALLGKGAALGTTLAFMMAVTALSFPEFMILKKVMKPKLIALFAGVVAVGIVGRRRVARGVQPVGAGRPCRLGHLEADRHHPGDRARGCADGQGRMGQARLAGGVAVIDPSCLPLVLLRDRYAGWHTVAAAAGKARTAASWREATSTVAARVNKPGAAEAAIRNLPGVVMIGGGLPIEAAGQRVGAIGVSGAPGGDNDDVCAKAGIAAVEADLAF